MPLHRISIKISGEYGVEPHTLRQRLIQYVNGGSTLTTVGIFAGEFDLLLSKFAPQITPTAANNSNYGSVAANSLPCKLFELGCGNGQMANRLTKLGYDVTAVDVSSSGITMGRQAFPHLRLFEGSAYDNLAEEYGRFPIAISLEVIERIYDPRRYTGTFFELLEPDGMGIIATPYHVYLKNMALAMTGKMDSHFTALWGGGISNSFLQLR